MITGGWRLVLGAALLSVGLMAPVTVHAGSTTCGDRVETELPVPQDVLLSSVTGAAGSWAVGNGYDRAVDQVMLV